MNVFNTEVKCKVIPVLNYDPCHEDIWGNGNVAACILNLTLEPSVYIGWKDW
jgi:hypothetical protein